MNGPPKRERPRRATEGDERDDGRSFSDLRVASPAAIVNAYCDRFRLDSDIDYAVAPMDPLMPVFTRDYFDLRTLQRRPQAVAP